MKQAVRGDPCVPTGLLQLGRLCEMGMPPAAAARCVLPVGAAPARVAGAVWQAAARGLVDWETLPAAPVRYLSCRSARSGYFLALGSARRLLQARGGRRKGWATPDRGFRPGTLWRLMGDLQQWQQGRKVRLVLVLVGAPRPSDLVRAMAWRSRVRRLLLARMAFGASRLLALGPVGVEEFSPQYEQQRQSCRRAVREQAALLDAEVRFFWCRVDAGAWDTTVARCGFSSAVRRLTQGACQVPSARWQTRATAGMARAPVAAVRCG